jgi:hypothetical protein
MSVGTPTSKPQLDSAAGGVSSEIEHWVDRVLALKVYLDAAPDADLMAPPFSYTAQEVAILKSGIADLAQLARIYQGTEALAEVKDFGQFSRQMAGLVL